MRRLIPSLLLASFLFLSATFAGMSVFGMNSQMTMASHDCVGTACHTDMDMGAHDTMPATTDCVDHCLASAMALTTSTVPSIALLAFVLLFIAQILPLGTVAASAPRVAYSWREGIGKCLRHLQLDTIVLRN